MPINPVGALSVVYSISLQDGPEVVNRTDENLQTIRDSTTDEQICSSTKLTICRSSTSPATRKYIPMRVEDTLANESCTILAIFQGQYSQSSAEIFLTRTTFVYTRTSNRAVAITIPMMPTHVMSASPRRCGFWRSTMYPSGAGTMGLLRSIMVARTNMRVLTDRKTVVSCWGWTRYARSERDRRETNLESFEALQADHFRHSGTPSLGRSRRERHSTCHLP
jgi:hypothetical protein